MEIPEDTQDCHGSDRYQFDCWTVDVPIIYHPFLNASMGTQAKLVLGLPMVWEPFYLERPYFIYVMFSIVLFLPDHTLVLVIFLVTDILYWCFQKSSLLGWLVVSLKVEVSFSAYLVYGVVLVNLGGLYD